MRVIKAINKELVFSTYLSLVIDDIRKISSSFTSISFSHVLRVANRVAHNLAKWSISSTERIWMGDVPFELRSCINSDAFAALFE